MTAFETALTRAGPCLSVAGLDMARLTSLLRISVSFGVVQRSAGALMAVYTSGYRSDPLGAVRTMTRPTTIDELAVSNLRVG